MVITKNSVVTLDYSAKDSDGNIVDEGANPLVYLHGGYGDTFPPLEAALEGKQKGESIKVELNSENAFGEYVEDLVVVEDRNEFDDKIFVGEQLEGPSPFNEEEAMLYSITNITDTEVTLDGNHPLAGMDITFEATILEVREATKEERKHGHVHVDGACQEK